MNVPKSRFLLYFPLVIIRENWYNSKASYRCYRLLRRKAIPGINYNIIRGRKLKKIQEDIKTGNFRQAYLLYGEETYLKQQYKQNLAKALNPDGDTMNFSHYEGKGIDVKQLIDLCETMPFFADRRVILLEDTGFFKNKCDELADYMKELPEYLCLIFAESEVDKRSRMYKAVKSCGMIEEFARQDEKTLMCWAAGILGKAGRKITQRDMELLLTKTGTDMGNLRMELEKLISYTEGKDIVTAEDIEEICTTQTTNRIFDMVRAVTEKNQKRALDLYYDLLTLKEPPMRILFLLAKQYRQLLQAKQFAAAGLAQTEIASKLGVPAFVVRNISTCARAYTVSELEQAVADFVDAEEAVKTGRLEDKLSVELLIIKYSSKVS